MHPRRHLKPFNRLSGRSASWAPGERQRGQALVLAVVCLLVLCLGCLAVFDTGQTVTKKEQLINAADAASYSVAIEQARALNTVAYLNRAEVANQIAIAQIVSIQSYANYADSVTGRTANFLFDAGDALDATVLLAELGAALQELATAIKELQEGYAGALSGVDLGESAIVSGLNALNAVYSVAQADVLYAFSGNAGITTVNTVIHDNTLDADGQSHAHMAAAGEGILVAQLACFDGSSLCSGPAALTRNKGYTVRYTIPQQNSAGSAVERTWAADRVANVMMQARDRFSASPKWPFPDLPVSAFQDRRCQAWRNGSGGLRSLGGSRCGRSADKDRMYLRIALLEKGRTSWYRRCGGYSDLDGKR